MHCLVWPAVGIKRVYHNGCLYLSSSLSVIWQACFAAVHLDSQGNGDQLILTCIMPGWHLPCQPLVCIIDSLCVVNPVRRFDEEVTLRAEMAHKVRQAAGVLPTPQCS
jgi:hypothetical protein